MQGKSHFKKTLFSDAGSKPCKSFHVHDRNRNGGTRSARSDKELTQNPIKGKFRVIGVFLIIFRPGNSR
ncbi:MAG: hypothetical protein COS92_04560 [Desulfobacterales bacterium CG07_land_8_20_14_0_80_52_14]|nr:MAG: hypothetical protein COX20_10380 [Desulfobacterales bacterium CG23_combo_of_CG06-09_8_20_14_all_52_9]PIU49836.1 MAG: hypothetical protein COS92_04560 [Desulfobacterales bacterium CG07_land_8_20_14_0_80_52_14]